MSWTHPSDFNADAMLTGWAVDYRLHAEQHFADKIFPYVLVPKEAGAFKVGSAEDFFRIDFEEVPDGEPAPVVGRDITERPYQTAVVGGRVRVTRREMNNAMQTGIDPGRRAIRTAMKQAMLKRDFDFASAFFPTGASTIWGVGPHYTRDIDAADRWDADVAGDVMLLIKNARRRIQSKSGELPNVMLIGGHAWDVLTEHPMILDKIKHTQKGVITEELVAQLFMIDKVVVADAAYNSAKEGVARAINRHGDTTVLLAYANSSAPDANDNSSAGYCLEALDEGVPSIGGGGGIMVRSYYSNERRCFFYEVIMNYVMKIVDNNRAFLITNVVGAPA